LQQWVAWLFIVSWDIFLDCPRGLKDPQRSAKEKRYEDRPPSYSPFAY
jgi:hypothetical protein